MDKFVFCDNFHLTGCIQPMTAAESLSVNKQTRPMKLWNANVLKY